MYYPGLDIIFSLLFLLIIVKEADNQPFSLLQQGLIGLVWQLPAWLLSIAVLLGLDQSTNFSYYFIFMLQLWHTPILPLITLLPDFVYLDKPLYYYAMFIMAPLLGMIYMLPYIIRRILRKK